MATASITKLGGVVVVTQVIPQDEAGQIPMQTPGAPPTASKAPPPQSSCTPKMDDKTAIFLKAGPEVLGTMQIIVGLLCIVFSLTAIFSPILLYHVPFCIGLIFIISGSVALKATRSTSVSAVRWTLVLNVFSLMFSLVGVAYLGWCFVMVQPSLMVCGEDLPPIHSESTRGSFSCIDRLWTLDRVLYGLWGSFIVLLIFQACVSVTLAVFSGKAIRCSHRYGPAQVVVSDYDSDVRLLDPAMSSPSLNSA